MATVRKLRISYKGCDLSPNGETSEVKLFQLGGLNIQADLEPEEALVCLDGEGNSVAVQRAESGTGYWLPENSKGAAGWYHFYAEKGERREPFAPDLYIDPQNITREQYKLILQDLRDLAVRVRGVNRVEVFRQTALPSSVDDRNIDQPMRNILDAAAALIQQSSDLRAQWPQLETFRFEGAYPYSHKGKKSTSTQAAHWVSVRSARAPCPTVDVAHSGRDV